MEYDPTGESQQAIDFLNSHMEALDKIITGKEVDYDIENIPTVFDDLLKKMLKMKKKYPNKNDPINTTLNKLTAFSKTFHGYKKDGDLKHYKEEALENLGQLKRILENFKSQSINDVGPLTFEEIMSGEKSPAVPVETLIADTDELLK